MSATGLKSINCDIIESDFIIVQGEDLLHKINDVSNNLFNNYYNKEYYDSSYNYINDKFSNYRDIAYSILNIETPLAGVISSLETATGVASGAAALSASTAASLTTLNTFVLPTYLKTSDASNLYYNKSYIDTSFNNVYSSISNLNQSGILSVSQGGTGLNTFASNQLLIGNGTSAIKQSTSLTFNDTTKLLQITGDFSFNGKITGAGTSLTALNASNITSGILSIYQGGTGLNTLISGQLLIGNGTSAIKQSAYLSFIDNDNSKILNMNGDVSCNRVIGAGTKLTALNASNITSGILSISQGGMGINTFTNTQIIYGNSSNGLSQSSGLVFDSQSNSLYIGSELYLNNTSLTNKLSQKQDVINVTAPIVKYNNNLSLDLVGTNYWIKDSSSRLTYYNNVAINADFADSYDMFLVGNRIRIRNGAGNTLQQSYTRITTNNSNRSDMLSSESYMQLIENIGISFRTVPTGNITFSLAGINYPLTISQTGSNFNAPVIVSDNPLSVQYNSQTVFNVDNNGIQAKGIVLGSNISAKNFFKFTTSYYSPTNKYIYSLDLTKYYKTGQTIDGQYFGYFNIYSWTTDPNSIIICKAMVVIIGSSKYVGFDGANVMHYDGTFCEGWQTDTDPTLLHWASLSNKTVISVIENIL